MKTGTWDVTTIKDGYCIDILTDEIRRFKLDLLGVSETHSPGVGSMKLGDIEFVYSDRKDGVHRQGVGLIVLIAPLYFLAEGPRNGDQHCR